MTKNFRHIILYGLTLSVLVFVLKWVQWKFLIVDNSVDIYVGLVAVFFTVLGVWIAKQVARPQIRTVVLEKEIVVAPAEGFKLNVAELENLNLSAREYEVLLLLAKGHSNADIAEALFLSVSTIKTHISNIYLKLDVKRRVQAVEKARSLGLVP